MSFQHNIIKHVVQGHIGGPGMKASNTKAVKKLLGDDGQLPEEIKYDIEVYKSPIDMMHNTKCSCGCGGIDMCLNTEKESPIVKKYIYKKINESNIILELDPMVGAAMAGAAVSSALTPVMDAGIKTFFSATDAIKGIYKKFKYDVFGCSKIYDPNDRQACEQRHRLRMISDLQRQMPKCNKAKDPEECKQRINDKIESVRNKGN